MGWKGIAGLALVGIAVLVAIYALWLRPWIREKPWAHGFFAAIEPVELLLYGKSETVLWARFKQVLGILLMALAQLGEIDITPLLPFVPEDYRPYAVAAINMLPMIVWLDGKMGVILRKDVSTPLEVVALPINVPENVAIAVADAASASNTAVAVVEESKAQGAMA